MFCTQTGRLAVRDAFEYQFKRRTCRIRFVFILPLCSTSSNTPALVSCRRCCSLTLTTVLVLGQTNSPFQRWTFYKKHSLIYFQMWHCSSWYPWDSVSVVPGRFPTAQQCGVNLFSIALHAHTRTHTHPKVAAGSRAPKASSSRTNW